MFFLAKYGTQTTFWFPVVKAGSTDLASAADWTPATGDTKITKDGANVANSTNNPVAVGGTGSVLWSLTLTAAELTAAVVVVQIVDSPTKAITDQVLVIYTFGNAAAKIAADLSDSVRLGLTALPNLAHDAEGGLSEELADINAVTAKLDTTVELDGAVYRFTANALEQAPSAGDIPSASEIAGEVVSQLVALNMVGTAQGGTVNTITLEATETGVLVGQRILIVAGQGAGQAPRHITSWNNTTKEAVVTPNWESGKTPNSTSVYLLVP